MCGFRCYGITIEPSSCQCPKTGIRSRNNGHWCHASKSELRDSARQGIEKRERIVDKPGKTNVLWWSACISRWLINYILTVYIANGSTLDHHQSSVPWPTHFENSAMAGASVLSTLPNFPISNTVDYDNIDVESLFAMNSSDSTPPSFETVLPGEPEAEMMANVPRTFDGIRFSSMFKGSAFAYPFPHLPTYPQFYPDFKPLACDLPAIH